MQSVLRVARPTEKLAAIAKMYERGFGFAQFGCFVDHEGFDGIMVDTAISPITWSLRHSADIPSLARLPKIRSWCSMFRTGRRGCCAAKPWSVPAFSLFPPYNPVLG